MYYLFVNQCLVNTEDWYPHLTCNISNFQLSCNNGKTKHAVAYCTQSIQYSPLCVIYVVGLLLICVIFIFCAMCVKYNIRKNCTCPLHVHMLHVINANYLEECAYSMLRMIILREWREDQVIILESINTHTVECYSVVNSWESIVQDK